MGELAQSLMGESSDSPTTPNTIELPDGDYKADDGLWVSCRGAAIRIYPNSNGISIQVYADGREMDGSVLETWVTYQELEPEPWEEEDG